MARTRPAGRLDEILDAALEVFSSMGYRRARMADVAHAAGVSPGLLYTYVAGKEALFSLVVRREVGVEPAEFALPVENPPARTLEALVTKSLRELVQCPTLDAALATNRASRDVRAEVEAILREVYDSVHRARRLVRLLERSALDWPELGDRYYRRGRQPFIHQIARYIERRSKSSAFHTPPDATLAARFVLETIAWFAYHRYGDYDGADIPDDIARETVVQLLTNSLVPS